jgi:N4-(beta-N-acetylglucosaminyl)-L-asparaginase
VGYGGSPDESGETTLDAVIMDGVTHDAGSVASLKRVKNAISVARAVMEYTKHTLLVGEGATQFAIDMGFKQTDLHSIESVQRWIDWFNNSCQPNFRQNVWPSPLKNCGPYKPLDKKKFSEQKQVGQRNNPHVSAKSHDTIGMLVLDSNGNIAGGTSTNGASHKLPGYLLEIFKIKRLWLFK